MNQSKDYQEKRDFLRMVVNECAATFQVEGGGVSGGGSVKDLSGGGLLMLCDQALPQDAILTVQVSADQASVPPLRARARVVRVTAGDDGRYAVGLRVDEYLPRE